MKAADVFATSDGAVTRRYYAALEQRGVLGLVALNLFRAQKCSTRAKVYRGGIRGVGSYRGMAYERKSWSMGQLVDVLGAHGDDLRIRHGWKQDNVVVFGESPSWVLYVDLPNGQVSFHSPARGSGPDYAFEWDGARASEERILAFCDAVFAGSCEHVGMSLFEEPAPGADRNAPPPLRRGR